MSISSQIIFETITSDALRANPLGDPYQRRVPVYLPPGYNQNKAHYPVVYLLSGFTGRGAMMLNDSPFNETIQERMDRLIAAGQVQPMILVLPDCITRYGGSQYLNSSATGRYEDHLIDELVPGLALSRPIFVIVPAGCLFDRLDESGVILVHPAIRIIEESVVTPGLLGMHEP